ncbi:beta-CASP ribonuclease aCPSF1 [Candidatus Bathyarchaeota archaeon]|jgi:KH/beta-lactamase-domain protein|nr:beta-CASP ribonuclease aCPSF1 [Candidatus Bathyarchaeota archaeon]
MARPIDDSHARIRETILSNMPKEAEITRIEFEGPRLAIYVKNVVLLLEQSYVVTDIVNLLHKRVVIRSDPSIRVTEAEAEKLIKSAIPQDAEITNITFDPSLGEVTIEAKKPGLAIGKDGSTLQEVIKTTSWRPRVLRAPPMPSKIVTSTRHILHSESEARNRILRDVGERIFRPRIGTGDGVFITPLGAFHEVGRSALLVQTSESSVLLDLGINPGSNDPVHAYPKIGASEFDIDRLDAVIISHAHLDHCGFVPFLYKYGYDGPVYCSEPTGILMTLLQLDYLDVYNREGAHAPYDQKDVRETVMHTIPLKYGVVTDVAPDVKLTLHNAGHILGSSIIHLHIGEGYHNIVYTGDFKFGRTMLLEPASCVFPRAETLVIESTYGGQEDVMPERTSVEGKLASIVNEAAEKGGKVLIPVPAVGRSQEVMLVLDSYMKNGLIKEMPIYLEGMILEATAIHTAFPEYLVRELRDQMLHKDINPFQSDYFSVVSHPSDREQIVAGQPAIIMATSGMLEGGPAIDYFKQMASDPKNVLLFVSYQIEGTLGSRLKNGVKEVSMMGRNGKIEAIKVDLKIESVEGFSGHSDRNQLLAFLRRISPKPSKVVVGHGERHKVDSFAHAVSRTFKVRTIAPDLLETIKLK